MRGSGPPSVVHRTDDRLRLPRATPAVSQSSAARILNDVPSFDVVDAVTPVGTAPCAECRGPIVDTYFETDRGVLCDACHTRLAADVASRSTRGYLARALGFGTLGAAIGSAIYFGVLTTTGREVSLVAVVVGLVVGKAVRLGARGQGGRRLQWLAVCLTYLTVATTYLPFVLKGFTPGATAAIAPLGTTAVDVGALLLLAVVAPALEGATHPVTLTVLVLALATAWRLNRRTELRMRGPYHVRPTRA